MANLYELTGRMQALMDLLETGEDLPEDFDIEQQYADAAMSYADKLDGYARVRRNLEAQRDALKTEIDRLSKMKSRLDKNIDRIIETVQASMTAVGAKKMATSVGTWSIAKNPISVTIKDESKVPAEYRIPQPDKIDKVKLKEYLVQTGEVLDCAELVQTEGLRFR